MSQLLISYGARLRPPRPEPRFEEPGMAPFPDARWIAGRWEWRGAQWIWIAGGWSDPGRFGETGGEVAVRVEPPPPPQPEVIVVSPPTTTTTTTIHVAPPPVIIRGRTTVVRDHRDRERPLIRDRREPKRPVVRDHRRKRDDK